MLRPSPASRLAAFLIALVLALPALAQAPQRPAQQAQPAPPQFTIKNEGEVTLMQLYVARGGQGARGWGPDRFGAEVVPPGESFRVRLPQGFGCTVDIRIVFEDGEEEVRERVDVCRAREVAFARAAPTAPEERTIAVLNRSPRTIRELYVSGARERNWGSDRLGTDVIEPGDDLIVRFPDQGCHYDLRVVFDTGAAEERRGVDFCALDTLPVTPGWTTVEDLAALAQDILSTERPVRPEDPGGEQIEVANRSGRTVAALFVFPDGAERGPNLLDARGLIDGAIILVPGFQPPVCLGTVVVIYGDGTEERRSGIDLCTLPELVIEPGWTGAAPGPVQREGRGPANASPGTVGITNRSGRTVFELYTFPDGASNEGPDRLGADVLRAGGAVRVPAARPPGCATTVRIVYDNGEQETRSGLDFCRLSDLVIEPGWTTAAVAGSARIVNAGPLPIVTLHADPPGAPRGPDRLGDAVIGVGQGFTLAPPQQGVCAYDLTAVFRDRRTVRVPGADLCAGTEIRIAP